MSEYEKPADGYAIVTNYGAFVGIWCDEVSAKTVHKARTPSAPEERVVPVYFAARQPSPSARDVALKCVEICAGRKAGRDPSNPRWLEANTCENLLRAFADTLGNESTATQATSDRGTSSAMSAEASDPNGTGTGPASAAAISVGNEFVAQVDGYGNGAPDAPPPAAMDPAPEAAELQWTIVHNMCESAIGLDYRWSRKNAEILRDMALRSLDLQQALAQAQEERDAWHRVCKDLCDDAECLPECNSFVHEENCPIGSAAANIQFQIKRAERAEAELAKVREELDKRPRTEFVAVGWWDGRQSLFESGMTPERGALLFRPLSGGAMLAAAQAGQPDEQSEEGK